MIVLLVRVMMRVMVRVAASRPRRAAGERFLGF
ncbi:hypothetical protein HNR28_002981 [Castellaniella defragrans]|uniref:Uncharacterized protein n=1 Tax=Castellaniella defragrans TaxID=75697 RepID=A0A7W9WPU6_CASDE|nr:hypothetical protein [Castellaniella defragrans]